MKRTLSTLLAVLGITLSFGASAITCNDYAATAGLIAKERDKGTPMLDMHIRAANVNAPEEDKIRIIRLISVIYEDKNTRILPAEDIHAAAFLACIKAQGKAAL